ncbi:MAG: non-homologous end-joining DNA ligase [Thermaerobacter sp.]|nr:non-homologous end-joining DNA ligase [Thermaerobacter sp.]
MDQRTVHVPRLDKIFFPDDAITKADVLDYYLTVFDQLQRHLAGRPLTLIRYPDGITGKSFFQKNPPSGAPDWLSTWTIRDTRYVLLKDRETLAYLVGQGAVELHAAPVRFPDADRPDIAVVDLDPMPPAGFEEARAVAKLALSALEALGLQVMLKTSGATGLHLFLPIRKGPTCHELMLAVKGLGQEIRRAAPQLVTLERSVAKRTGVYFDYGQNAFGHTLAAAYSLRAHQGAPVSCPITVQELAHVRPQDFTLRTVPRRLALAGDIWRNPPPAQDPAPLLRLAALAGTKY